MHAIVQAGATLLFGGSLLARPAGRRGSGIALAVGGLATATVGGYLGGYLAMRLGAGSSHAEPVGHLAAIGWQDLCPLAELPEGRPARRQLGYLSLLAVRAGRGRLRPVRPVLAPRRPAAPGPSGDRPR